MVVNELNAWRHDEARKKKKTKVQDEYEDYLSTPPLDQGSVSNLVKWWGHRTEQWPNLSRLALDAISIPAMSAECERCFSNGKRLITDERGGMGAEAIEACSCLRHWLINKHG